MGAKSQLVAWPNVINPYLATVGRGALSDRLRCPDAQAQTAPHPVSYVINIIVGITPSAELLIGMPPRAQLKPSRVSLMLREGTALVWDTAVSTAWSEDLGYLAGADIDSQRFWSGAVSPQFRYFDPADPYAQLPPGTLGQNQPVRMGSNWRNIDATVFSPGLPIPGQPALPPRRPDEVQCAVLRRQRAPVHRGAAAGPYAPVARRAAAILHDRMAAQHAAEPERAVVVRS